MRRDAVTISKLVNKKRNFKPRLILDVGYQTRLSSFELHRKFPNATILSWQYDYSNFLIDSTDLAYHDKIIFKYFNINSFHLDDMVFGMVTRDAVVDLIHLDVRGKEKDIFKFSGMWAEATLYIKVRLGQDYDYKEAKKDLALLGFESYATYDKENFFVTGERRETFRGNSPS